MRREDLADVQLPTDPKTTTVHILGETQNNVSEHVALEKVVGRLLTVHGPVAGAAQTERPCLAVKTTVVVVVVNPGPVEPKVRSEYEKVLGYP